MNIVKNYKEEKPKDNHVLAVTPKTRSGFTLAERAFEDTWFNQRGSSLKFEQYYDLPDPNQAKPELAIWKVKLREGTLSTCWYNAGGFFGHAGRVLLFTESEANSVAKQYKGTVELAENNDLLITTQRQPELFPNAQRGEKQHKSWRVKLLAGHTAQKDQIVDGYLGNVFGCGKIELYPRGEAIKKAQMFGGKAEEVKGINPPAKATDLRSLCWLVKLPTKGRKEALSKAREIDMTYKNVGGYAGTGYGMKLYTRKEAHKLAEHIGGEPVSEKAFEAQKINRVNGKPMGSK